MHWLMDPLTGALIDGPIDKVSFEINRWYSLIDSSSDWHIDCMLDSWIDAFIDRLIVWQMLYWLYDSCHWLLIWSVDL